MQTPHVFLRPDLGFSHSLRPYPVIGAAPPTALANDLPRQFWGRLLTGFDRETEKADVRSTTPVFAVQE